ncbi:MAG: FadR/GntR family transcriptional regulator [Acidobacteriaceae bacterium]|jgi:GntR family transcriptional repressor for pyruvate dehydrogenase complex
MSLVRELTPGNVSAAPRESLSTQTLDQLIGWLKDGTFKAGGKLPSQNELVEYFGVSRTGIREALQMMAVLNLIEIKPGLGCFVKRVSPEYIIHADVLSILLDKESVMEVIEARKLVESGIAALAAERALPEDYWRMEDVLIAIDRSIQKNESIAVISTEFHCALAEASHNAVLAKLVRSFTQLMAKAGQLLEDSIEDLGKFKRHELKSHQELFHVIKQRDPEKSRKAMIDHITYSEKLIVGALKRAEKLESAALEASDATV